MKSVYTESRLLIHYSRDGKHTLCCRRVAEEVTRDDVEVSCLDCRYVIASESGDRSLSEVVRIL